MSEYECSECDGTGENEDLDDPFDKECLECGGKGTLSRPVVRCESSGFSSARYGNCECCDKHASEIFIGTGNNGRTYVFGHEACVRKAIGFSDKEIT